MNETISSIRLIDLMENPEGWGRDQGRRVFQLILDKVEATPESRIFQLNLEGVERFDLSFASESIVELARRYRSTKGFFITHVANADMEENLSVAAERKQQPLMVWDGKLARVIGLAPSQGTSAAFDFALKRRVARASDFAQAANGISISNASTKFKQLWQQGFLLRQEELAPSGGIEYSYICVG